ncbi:MAG: apolipoprotein N-acyltransferase [Candidatus Binatia bacterium]
MPAILLVVVASALLHALAFAPWHLWPLAWCALAPFLWVVGRSTPARGVLAGLVWGSVAIWGVGGWVAPAIAVYYEQPLWFGIAFCVVGCMLLWGLPAALFGGVASWFAARTAPPLRPVLLAALWVCSEFLRARLVTGEPWMQLGYALTDVPLLMQAADLGSVPLLSFVLALVNASLVELVRPRGRSLVVLLGAPLLATGALLVYGGWRLATPFESRQPVAIAVVQGNNALRTQWRREFYGDTLERYVTLSRGAAARRPRLLVWPESAVTFFLGEEPAYRSHIGRLLEGLDAQLVVGGPERHRDADGWRHLNSAFLMDRAGGVLARYDKERLLPFAEFFPLRFLAFLRRRFEQVRNFAPGDGQALLPTPAGRAAVVICFEAIFPELVRERMGRGAEILLNLSNDIWLGPRAGPEQHFQMVVLRAVESRTWVVRATTTGVSAVIDPHGRVRRRAPRGEPAVLTDDVGPVAVETVYERVGDVFAWACMAGVLAAAAVLAARPRDAA